MICKAIQVQSPNVFQYGDVDIGQPNLDQYEVSVQVAYSSICGTDLSIIDGSLLYYQEDIAKYPIITGHEWCGVYDEQPVVGLCILGCYDNACLVCKKQQYVRCLNRKEVGVINKDGGHAEYIHMPLWALFPIRKVAPEYALIEPLAVVMHGLGRISIKPHDRVMVLGQGNIGIICSKVLKFNGIEHDVYDPKYHSNRPKMDDYDFLIECSGASDVLCEFIDKASGTILAFGFEYDDISPGQLVTQEINFISSLGSTKDDFKDAINMLPFLHLDHFSVMPLSKFSDAISLGGKVVLKH